MGNIFKKMQTAKKILKDADIKKSGHVNFGNIIFDYYIHCQVFVVCTSHQIFF